jgi:hypothetical protein
MRKLVILFMIGLSSVVAHSQVLPTDSNLQKVSCFDKKTGALRFRMDRVQGHEDVIFGISTDYYTGVFESVSDPSMYLTEVTDSTAYFKSGFSDNENSLSLDKFTEEGHLILLSEGTVATDVRLKCELN